MFLVEFHPSDLCSSRNDMATVMDALEVSAEMHRKDSNNVPEFVQRHLLSLSIWEELRYKIILCLFMAEIIYILVLSIGSFVSLLCFLFVGSGMATLIIQ
jgi:hypothetical protein